MKAQKISRKDLQTIYGQVCQDWQKKITELALWQSGDTIEVEETLIKKAFNDANETQKEMLKKYFDVFKSVTLTDRDLKWKDILELAGEEEENVVPFNNPKNKKQKALNAAAKIQLIAEVLNEGWTEDYKNSSQSKWYPWFEKKSSGWVLVSVAGVWYYDSVLGAGLSYRDERTALYAGKQFKDIYEDYLSA